MTLRIYAGFLCSFFKSMTSLLLRIVQVQPQNLKYSNGINVCFSNIIIITKIKEVERTVVKFEIKICYFAKAPMAHTTVTHSFLVLTEYRLITDVQLQFQIRSYQLIHQQN